MIQQLSLKLLPADAASAAHITQQAAAELGIPAHNITGYHLLKRSIDARSRQAYFILTLQVFINEPFQERVHTAPVYPALPADAPHVIIAGAGPAGLFAALRLIEAGIRPVILERGKDVRARRRDLAALNKTGVVHPDSNYCFGEGGAGTYSDGKLYTRSNKRGDINRILNIFVHFGAEEKIMIDAHPHIGTNKLPHIITAMREQIIASGGEVHFEQKVTALNLHNNTITGVKTASGETFEGKHLILATGHSARDIFTMLHRQHILLEAKPFALGVRIEHPQELIDSAQYHCTTRGEYLPPASYSLVEQVEGRGVFSFCMCPGGIIAPAATDPGELVVNGWSPSKRNNPFANSGMVVTVDESDFAPFAKHGPLAAMYFQQAVEKKAYAAGGGNFVAPAQRMTDFVQKKISATLPECSYVPGLHSADLRTVLPATVHQRLAGAFKAFGRKMKGYYSENAVLVATESRTSSPVRIPRLNDTLEHPQVAGLYPCAEGAGYAGGIVSAAMDGERVAAAIAAKLR
ncbi:NAD(P)/FAD-dependent oxidoreductase [Chitinophaga nivalis]|uniref:FAD-dependent monooxygenase n=1 Tax=Chitinophaga nivalis TaxID=2991709 RepID=A0ABT3IUF0_9BACT|nr:FAD-dependent monooxygenase [Chitinophaga nivalis]MCW3462965.1 FAD-dependent monooxygenase [Chitinophaga nivalis]MCW3487345.1 FAD-dependent monooxygenase [Chitinophaga nivalis]